VIVPDSRLNQGNQNRVLMVRHVLPLLDYKRIAAGEYELVRAVGTCSQRGSHGPSPAGPAGMSTVGSDRRQLEGDIVSPGAPGSPRPL
jgi:hypothetical protein